MEFYKYHGTGNDFIMIDGRNKNFIFNKEKIKQICDRNYGIGSDGFIILKNHLDYDFEMQFFNPDGSEAAFCGNGARCIVAFAKYLGIIKNKTIFWAKDGKHSAYLEANQVVLKMIDVAEIKQFDDLYYINTGTHHVVKFVDNIENINVQKTAPFIRYHKNFEPYGVNVNFVQKSNNLIKIRTYEKGVEKETLSCGTGVVASALIYSLKENIKISEIKVKTQGGTLKVKFEKTENNFKNIYLQGNAVQVFKGKYLVSF